jgi:hypothetical protein
LPEVGRKRGIRDGDLFQDTVFGINHNDLALWILGKGPEIAFDGLKIQKSRVAVKKKVSNGVSAQLWVRYPLPVLA